MNTAKTKLINAGILLVSVTITLLVCNWMLAKFIGKGGRTTAQRLVATNSAFANYTSQETDFSLPLYTQAQGQACVEVIRNPGEMHYSPYFGWNTQQINAECAQAHLSQKGMRVIYFGGSAMENFEAPNYLTKIDNYIAQAKPAILSLNLAESGGRSTNNLVRIMIEAINLPADYWVFLDGYNEFNSIKYGGDAKEDFYWTAGVFDRIHKPIRSSFDKLIAKSVLAQKLFYSTGLLKTPRRRTSSVTEEEIFAAADYYVENVQKIELLCKAKDIKCLFFLQPYKVENNESTRILNAGYARIISKLADKTIDLRPLFTDKDEAFVDDVHYNKLGSAIVGAAIAKHIL